MRSPTGLFPAAHREYISHISGLRNIESIVPCAALVESRHRLEVLALARVERLEEGAVGVQRPECAE